jgi:hypothetical protein
VLRGLRGSAERVFVLAAQDPAAAQDALGDCEQLADALQDRLVELAAQRRVGCVADLAPPLAEDLHVLLVSRVGKRPAQLDQQRLDPDPKLKGGLADPPGVEVEAGAGKHRLADVELLAAPEYRGDPLLGPQIGLAAGAASPGRRARLQLAGLKPLALGELLSAPVADPHRQCPLAAQLVDVGIAAGGALGRERPVQQPQALLDGVGEPILVSDEGRQPLAGLAVVGEGLRLYRRYPGQRQLGRRPGLRLAGAPPPPGRAGGAERLDDENLLLVGLAGGRGGPGQKAPIAEPDPTRKLELCEGEELGLGYGRSLEASRPCEPWKTASCRTAASTWRA